MCPTPAYHSTLPLCRAVVQPSLRYRTAAALLPHCHRTAPALLPHCPRTAAALPPQQGGIHCSEHCQCRLSGSVPQTAPKVLTWQRCGHVGGAGAQADLMDYHRDVQEIMGRNYAVPDDIDEEVRTAV